MLAVSDEEVGNEERETTPRANSQECDTPPQGREEQQEERPSTRLLRTHRSGASALCDEALEHKGPTRTHL